MAYTPKNPNSQATMANSSPVVVASDQTKIKVDLTETTANSVAIKVDNSAVTQPISATSLPLPTGAATAALQTQPGVDIGDVTINNAAGASAVNIQDGGNTITVDGTVTANLSATDNAVLDEIELDTTSISRVLNTATDSFGHIIIGDINNDIDVQFYRATSDSNLSNIITETEANGGTASRSNGMATFATTTTSNSRAKGVSLVPVVYTAGSEVYMIFTAAFPTATGGTGSYRRIGLYNDLTDGFFIGYETTGTFGVSLLRGASITTTLKANFSNDTLVGGAGSLFTRAGTPEAIDLTKLNIFRIRFGWLGSAPIKFEVMSPDGHWVTFHTISQPNLAALPSINTADLYATCDVATGTSGNAQSILSNCWGAGTTQKLRKINDTLTTNSLAGLTRAVLTGETTGGGGGFVNVKVNPSGAITADVTGTVKIDQTTNGTTNNTTNRDATYAKFVCDTSTLVANTSKTASLTVSGFTAVEIEITNVNGASTIYYTLDNTTPSSTNFSGILPATPCNVVLPCNGTPTLKLISAGTPIWGASVRGV